MIRKTFYLLIILLFHFNVFANDFISGNPRIIDGDTIKMNGISIRLHGIDTPEKKQKCKDINNKFYDCGEMATRRLKSIIGSNLVECKKKDKDRYQRIIGECFVGLQSRINLNYLMVLRGQAVAYIRYSEKYSEAQNQAKKGKGRASFKAANGVVEIKLKCESTAELPKLQLRFFVNGSKQMEID